jgi:hypothetical protein
MKDTASTDAPAIIELGADLSHAVKALETAYRMIQRKFPEVPHATIVVKRDAKAWGHTTVAKTWAPADKDHADRLEIMISGENLARGARHVAATLLHESAHAWDLALGILDTDVNGRHNKLFKLRAEELGLTVEEMGWHGWTKTELPTELDSWTTRLVATVDRGLQRSAKAAAPAPVVEVPPATGGVTVVVPPAGTVAPPRKRGNRNLIKAVCDCGDSIRASLGVLERCQPRCEVCQEPFAPVA